MPEHPTILLGRARDNHAIHRRSAMAIAKVSLEALRMGMGNEGHNGWAVRDCHTGAHLRVWTTGLTGQWLVAWIDGHGHPGSGRNMAECLCGEPAGGQLIVR